MWIALNRGFVSVVTADMARLPKAELKHRRTGEFLCVRARNADHLREFFPGRTVYQWQARDYPARIFIDRADFADWLVERAASIDYGNFKSSVPDDELHDAYMGVWSVMNRYGNGGFKRRPYTYSPQQESFYDRFTGPPGEPLDMDDAGHPVDCGDGEVCGLLGCTQDNPCRDCIDDAIAATDRYGDFDDRDDEDAQSHLRVPPK